MRRVMGTSVYDNWERLVDATLNREKLRRLANCPSFSTTADTDTDTDNTVLSSTSISNGYIFGHSIQLAYSLIRFAEDSTTFRTQCLQLKSNAQKLVALLHQAARAGYEQYDRPVHRIVDELVQVLGKALALVLKCRGNTLVTRVFIITPTAAFSKTLSQLENCIGNVSWFLSISGFADDLSDEYPAIPPFAANEPILCLIWEQIDILCTGTVEVRAHAAEWLGSLAGDNDRYRKLIIQEGGVGPLLKLVKEGKLEAREQAARVIGLLGKDSESVDHMIHAGVCSEFAEILKEGPTRVQAVVSRALSEFVVHNPKCPNYLTNFGYDKDFDKKYTIGKLLGHGKDGYVYVAIDKSNGDRLAVKRADKRKMVLPIAVEDVKREVKIFRALAGHENVVHFYNAFEDDTYVYIVMELCEGGKLLDRILSKKDSRYAEKDAVIVVRQMLKVAAECHLHGFVHRDIMLENFLFKSKKEDSPLKVTNFGLSGFIRPGKNFRSLVGKSYYVAPEVLKRKSGPESDVWSIGVITYILLCGRRPFWDRTRDDIFKEILRNKPNFRREPWPGISNAAKDFVKKLLVKDPRTRLTAAQALSHPWVREGREASDIPLDISVLSNMRQFVTYSEFKQFALQALANALDDVEQSDLRDQFDAIDVDKNGVISLEEMRQALEKDLPWKMKDTGVIKIFEAIDSNTDGLVDFSEFMAATLNVHQLEVHDSVKWQHRSQVAFENLDVDRDGYITPEELNMHTGLRGSIDPLLEEADIDKDGKISLAEFRRLLRTTT